MTQILQTVRALRESGIDAEVAEAADAVSARADIVHVFGDARPLLALGRPTAPVVATPIYFPRRYVFSAAVMYRSALRRHRAKAWVRHRAGRVVHAKELQRRSREFSEQLSGWCQADLVVVNSEAERRLFLADAPGSIGDVRVAHSGVEREAFHGDPAEGRRILGVAHDPFVLCVARIEPIKNQVSLALAARRLGVRLVLVGSVLPGNERYLAAVKKVLPDLVHVTHVEHELLRHVHAAAAVHALPSWYETTGLSTLEALAAGRPVVVSGGSCVEDYFSGCATFCNPASVRSISRAVESAFAGPRGCEREHARSFGWDRTARELVDAYEAVLHAV